MKILSAFIIVGLICAIASIIHDVTKLTPGHITSIFVIIGALLSVFGLYDILIDNFGYGLSLPITSFGNCLVKSSYLGYQENGILGILSNMLKSVSLGITWTFICSFIVSMFCKPKD